MQKVIDILLERHVAAGNQEHFLAINKRLVGMNGAQSRIEFLLYEGLGHIGNHHVRLIGKDLRHLVK